MSKSVDEVVSMLKGGHENTNRMIDLQIAMKNYKGGKPSESIPDDKAYFDAECQLIDLKAKKMGYDIIRKFGGRGLL